MAVLVAAVEPVAAVAATVIGAGVEDIVAIFVVGLDQGAEDHGSSVQAMRDHHAARY